MSLKARVERLEARHGAQAGELRVWFQDQANPDMFTWGDRRLTQADIKAESGANDVNYIFVTGGGE